MAIGIDLIGYIGGSIIASSMPLQVYQSYNRGSTYDISWKWLFGYVTGILLLFIYAHLKNIPPVWGPLCLEITSTFILILLKIKYDIIEHKVYSIEISTQTDFPFESSLESSLESSKESNLKTTLNSTNSLNSINLNSSLIDKNNKNNKKYEMIQIETGDNDMV